MGKRGKDSKMDLAGMQGLRPKPAKPKPPRWLPAAARREWRRVVDVLDRLGVMTEADTGMLEGYCLCHWRIQEATATVAKEGAQIVTPTWQTRANPAIHELYEAEKNLRAFGECLALSPKARASLSIPPPDSEDEMDSFLREIGH